MDKWLLNGMCFVLDILKRNQNIEGQRNLDEIWVFMGFLKIKQKTKNLKQGKDIPMNVVLFHDAISGTQQSSKNII